LKVSADAHLERLSVYYLFLQYFDTVGWVFWPGCRP